MSEVIDQSELLARCERALGGEAAGRVFVPGRLEFLGKHTDYAGGRSLVCAIERGIAAAVAARDDASVRIIDVVGGTSSHFPLRADLAARPGDWSNYPLTVVRRVVQNFDGGGGGKPLRGADIAFASNLPAAAGLSSSSALIIATFLALDVVNEFRSRPAYRADIRTREELAEYLATVENGQSFGSLAGDAGVGTLGGSQDHVAILCGREGMLSQYSFAPVTHERDVPVPADHVFVVASSGVAAEKAAAAQQRYNRASRLVSEIVDRWRAKSGREDRTLAAAVRSGAVAVDQIRQILRGASGGPALLRRFEQFVDESEQIVPAAADALAAGDLGLLGRLVARSQENAQELLGNQVEETITLVKLALSCGAAAASAFGAGYGGSVWALARRETAGDFLDVWRARYLAAHEAHRGREEFFVSNAAPPARQGGKGP